MNERIIRMAEYSLHNEVYPPIVRVEYDPDDEMYPEAVRNAKRVSEYLEAQTVRIDDDDRMVGRMKFDGSTVGNIFNRMGHQWFGRACSKHYLKPYKELVTFDWEHSNADFGTVIRGGIEGMRERINASRVKYATDMEKLYFLEGLEIALNGILRWANRCAEACEAKAEKTADEKRRTELYEMAALCRRVPAKPARTFREAVQCVYFCWQFLPDSIGAPDRYFRPYYEADIASGRITKEEAEDLIGELLVMLSAFQPYTSGMADRGGECHFALGGYLPDHTDGFCDLSRLILDTMMKLPLVRPQVTVRWTPAMSRDTLYHILDCERNDKGKRIALGNDVPRIKAFMEMLGLPFEKACSYIMVGCNEPSFEGSIDLSGCISNIGKAITDVFDKRSRECLMADTFDAFYALFEEELETNIRHIVEYMNLFNAARARDINVISSPFITGCIERACSANAGGCETPTFCATLNGYITVIDSLTIVKQMVYDEHIFTMEKMRNMLAADWQGYEEEREMILKKGIFFGNDEDVSNAIIVRFNESLKQIAKKYNSLFGTKLIYGSYVGYWQHNVWHGERTGATPDGRHAGDPFVIGVGQTMGKDKEGMTALLNSAACAFTDGAINGSTVFNMLLDEALIRRDENFEKTVQIIETYFRGGGLMLQLNYVTKEELLEAQKHPEQHKNLRVRVSGFSANFVNLNAHLQNDVIDRTEKKF